MSNRVDVVIQPVVLRFSLLDDEVVYFFAADTEAVLDRMERMMGIDPAESALFDSNLGFLPVSTTVLIRGERNILVDPGNHHTGFYGQLGIGLSRFGLTPGQIDLVVCTHCHHDHMEAPSAFPAPTSCWVRGRPTSAKRYTVRRKPPPDWRSWGG